MTLDAAQIFLIPNGTFLAELIAFALILFVLYRYVVPPLQRAMRDRQETIRRQLEEGKEAEERLKAAEGEYQKAIAEARTEAARIRDDARAQGQHIIDELKAKAQTEADRVLERGREQLTADRATLVRELRQDIGRLSVELAERIVGESLADEARRRGTVERFLDGLQTIDGRLRSADGRPAAAAAEPAAGGPAGEPAAEAADEPAAAAGKPAGPAPKRPARKR